MNAWSNIETIPDDREMRSIDRLERALGDIPGDIASVRMLITRFEVCHFKYQTHYRHIVESIAALKPCVDIHRIGEAHPRNGAQAVEKDTTGRGRIGRQYITALRFWLGEVNVPTDDAQAGVNRSVLKWLGNRNAEKDRLVTMLLDRLLYRLDGYDYGNMTGLDLQVMKTDICCYAFPENMEKIIRAIGQLAPVAAFDGCGTASPAIIRVTGKWLYDLCQWLEEDGTDTAAALFERTPERLWLAACLAKTIKELVHSSVMIPVPPLPSDVI